MPTSRKAATPGAGPKAKRSPDKAAAGTAIRRQAVSPRSAAEAVLPETTASLVRLGKEVRRVLGLAGSATELSLQLAKAGARSPRQQAAISAAGSILKSAREAAGMTTREVGKAIDFSDIAMLEQAEVGKIALPFEVILRLAAVLGRHDPVTFAMRLARSYNPTVWKGLEDLGLGRFVIQAGRERELANIYRANDAARRLSDEDFAAVLAFAKTGFDAAVQFRGKAAAPATGRSPDSKSESGVPSAAAAAQTRRT